MKMFRRELARRPSMFLFLSSLLLASGSSALAQGKRAKKSAESPAPVPAMPMNPKNASSASGSPVSTGDLLIAPKDPIAYHDAKVRARALAGAEKPESWAQAERLLEQLTRDYPRDPENWWLLGQAKQGLKKYKEALGAYRNAGSYRPWYSLGWEEAESLRQIGDKQGALDLLRQQVFERRSIYRQHIYTDEDFEEFKSNPEFLEIVGRPDAAGWTRDYGWRRDIDFLAAEVKRVNPDYHDEPLPAEFVRRQEELKSKVPALSDEEILVGMNRMLATLHQGHTDLGGLRGSRIPVRLLPLQFWVFPEGTFIVGASPEHQKLVGHRLVKIEHTAAEEALSSVMSLTSVDGDMEYLLGAPSMLRSMAFLKGLGVVSSIDAATLTTRSREGRIHKVRLNSVPKGTGSIKLPAPAGAPAPLYLGRVSEMHWELSLPQQDAMYVQINNILEDKDESVPEFGRRLRKRLAEINPKSLIIDLRHNTGGTTQTYPEFLRTVVGFSQLPDKKVYVMIGRSTYSAAANLATDLERLADPLFVGEATSECCNFYGDSASFILPYSKIGGRVSGVKWNLSSDVFDKRREISPEVPVQLTAKDYFEGRDPALETVFKLIALQRKSSGTGAPPPTSQ